MVLTFQVWTLLKANFCTTKQIWHKPNNISPYSLSLIWNCFLHFDHLCMWYSWLLWYKQIWHIWICVKTIFILIEPKSKDLFTFSLIEINCLTWQPSLLDLYTNDQASSIFMAASFWDYLWLKIKKGSMRNYWTNSFLPFMDYPTSQNLIHACIYSAIQ